MKITKVALGLILAALFIGAMVMPAGATLAPTTAGSGTWFATSHPSTIDGTPTGAYIEFIFGPNGAITTNFISGATPYDRALSNGADDVLVNVQNISGAPLSSFHLTGATNDPNGGIFGFDGDGINTFGYNYYSGTGDTGYEGPGVTFSGYPTSGVRYYGDVNFTGSLAGDGATTWFALESVPNRQDIHPSTQVPEPTTLLLLGLGLVGAAGLRRFKK